MCRVGFEFGYECSELGLVMVNVLQNMQHLLVEGRVRLVDHFVRDDTVEEVARDRQHVREVAPRALEVEAVHLHLLVDVHVGEQLDLGVLGEVERGLTGPTLVVGEWENGVLVTVSRVHVVTTRSFYKQKVGL